MFRILNLLKWSHQRSASQKPCSLLQFLIRSVDALSRSTALRITQSSGWARRHVLLDGISYAIHCWLDGFQSLYNLYTSTTQNNTWILDALDAFKFRCSKSMLELKSHHVQGLNFATKKSTAVPPRPFSVAGMLLSYMQDSSLGTISNDLKSCFRKSCSIMQHLRL